LENKDLNKTWLAAIIPGVIAIIILVFVVVLLLIKLLWAWTVPDLFPGAVSLGLVAKTISWYTAFKLAIFASVMAGVAGARHEHYRYKMRSYYYTNNSAKK